MSYRKYNFSKAEKKEFAEKMREIEIFCKEHNISSSLSNDSYYFTLNGVNYRVSNHSIEASNSGAYDSVTGEQRRDLYHEGGREPNTVYIHAGKTRIIEIYKNLEKGYTLNKRGYIKKNNSKQVEII